MILTLCSWISHFGLELLKGFTMRSVTEECECVICGNEADLVIDCNLVDTSDPDHMKILQKDADVQVMPGY